jgi:hypothetical protein
MESTMARLYVAELGGSRLAQALIAHFRTIGEARQWAQSHGDAADWCVIRSAGRVVARHQRDTDGDRLRWARVVSERKPTAANPQRKFFILAPRGGDGALRLIGSVLARGESAAQVRHRLIERDGYPDDITVRRLDRERKGRVVESAGPRH